MALLPFGQDFQMRDMQNVGSPAGEYTALLTQAGTAAPTANFAINSVGTVAIARSSAGVYTLTTDGLWVADKTLVLVTISGTAVVVKAVRTSANVITISTFAADGTTATDLAGTLNVQVLVYP